MLEINCPSCLSSNILEDRQVARDINCITCGATFFVEKISEDEAQEAEEKKEAELEAAQEASNHISISTGTPPWDYDIIDTIFVLDTLNKNFFTQSKPSLAFKGAKAQMRTQAERRGGDAIVNCTFDYRISAGHGIFGASHDLEIFAYGTVVKRK